jgi:hypothetical protein
MLFPILHISIYALLIYLTFKFKTEWLRVFLTTWGLWGALAFATMFLVPDLHSFLFFLVFGPLSLPILIIESISEWLDYSPMAITLIPILSILIAGYVTYIFSIKVKAKINLKAAALTVMFHSTLAATCLILIEGYVYISINIAAQNLITQDLKGEGNIEYLRLGAAIIIDKMLGRLRPPHALITKNCMTYGFSFKTREFVLQTNHNYQLHTQNPNCING